MKKVSGLIAAFGGRYVRERQNSSRMHVAGLSRWPQPLYQEGYDRENTPGIRPCARSCCFARRNGAAQQSSGHSAAQSPHALAGLPISARHPDGIRYGDRRYDPCLGCGLPAVTD